MVPLFFIFFRILLTCPCLQCYSILMLNMRSLVLSLVGKYKGSSLRNYLAKLTILHGLLPFLLASVDFIQKSDCIQRIETKQHQTLNIAFKVYVMGLLSKYL